MKYGAIIGGVLGMTLPLTVPIGDDGWTIGYRIFGGLPPDGLYKVPLKIGMYGMISCGLWPATLLYFSYKYVNPEKPESKQNLDNDINRRPDRYFTPVTFRVQLVAIGKQDVDDGPALAKIDCMRSVKNNKQLPENKGEQNLDNDII